MKGYFEIYANPAMSPKASNQTQRKAYEHDLKTYGQSKSYHLEYTNTGCLFIPNHSPLIKPKEWSAEVSGIVPQDGAYTFVVIPSNGAPQLRISLGSHYFLADKADFVYAAGEIKIENGVIREIINQSGTYHVNRNSDTFASSEASFKEVLDAVDLPFNKYVPYQEKPKNSTCNQMFRLFTKENTMIACVAIAGGFLYGSL